MARATAAVPAVLAFLLRAGALQLEDGRPKGARRRAMERARRARLTGGGVESEVEEPLPVFCPADMENATVGAEAVCQPSTREAAVAALVEDFERFKPKVEEAVSKLWGGAYLTIGSWHTGPLLGNWVAHAKKITDADEQAHLHAVNVALDQGGMDSCENFHKSLPSGRMTLSCVFLAGWLPETLFSSHDGPELRPGSCKNNMVLWAKPLILKAAVEGSPHPIMLLETDVIMYKDMLALGASLLGGSEADMLTWLGGSKQIVTGVEGNGLISTGTVLATRASLPILRAWVEQDSKCLNSREPDKSALQHVLHYEGREANVATFSLGEVGQCGRKGSVATHYNCAGKKKALAMMGMHDWMDTISTDATEVMKPGKLFYMAPKA